MAILIDEKKRVLVQGITGREGRARTRLMREYGTNVVGGVTPGKGGQTVLGVPVFNTPQEAVDSLGGIDMGRHGNRSSREGKWRNVSWTEHAGSLESGEGSRRHDRRPRGKCATMVQARRA